MPRLDTGPLSVRLMAQGEKLGAAAIAHAAQRLASQPQPPGVIADALPDGVQLSGRRLKLRIVRDPGIGRFER